VRKKIQHGFLSVLVIILLIVTYEHILAEPCCHCYKKQFYWVFNDSECLHIALGLVFQRALDRTAAGNKAAVESYRRQQFTDFVTHLNLGG
jgi:hypothetical protein